MKEDPTVPFRFLFFFMSLIIWLQIVERFWQFSPYVQRIKDQTRLYSPQFRTRFFVQVDVDHLFGHRHEAVVAHQTLFKPVGAHPLPEGIQSDCKPQDPVHAEPNAPGNAFSVLVAVRNLRTCTYENAIRIPFRSISANRVFLNSTVGHPCTDGSA